MHTRSVEVAVGFPDHTWKNIWVEVPENPNYILDDDVASEKAEEMVEVLASQAGWTVTFIKVLYIQDPDGLDGIV